MEKSKGGFRYPDLQLFSVSPTDSDKLCKLSDERRHLLRDYDRSLINSNSLTVNIDELGTMQDGRTDVIVGGTNISCFYHSNGSSRLYVFLSGRKTGTVPEFKRWSWYPFVDGNSLCISDPMYEHYNDLVLGWYWGREGIDATSDYRYLISQLIEKVIEVEHIDDVVIYSSSAGGLPALNIADYIGNCTVVVINPQLKLTLYPEHKHFERITGIEIDSDPRHRGDATYFLENKTNRYILVENLRSDVDCQQISYLAEKKKMDLCYGLSQKDNIITWIYDGPGVKPHNVQDNYIIYMALNNLTTIRNIKSVKATYLLISEFWYQLSIYQKKIEEEKEELVQQKTEANNDSDVFVYCRTYTKEYALTVASRDYIWNHKKVNVLEPASHYKISFQSTGQQPFTIVLKDINKNRIIVQKESKLGYTEITFSTGRHIEGMELRIYPGSIGHSNNINLNLKMTVNQEK